MKLHTEYFIPIISAMILTNCPFMMIMCRWYNVEWMALGSPGVLPAKKLIRIGWSGRQIAYLPQY